MTHSLNSFNPTSLPGTTGSIHTAREKPSLLRKVVRRRTVGNTLSPQTYNVYSSPTSFYSPTFAPSPLVSEFSSPNAFSTYSPSIYGTPSSFSPSSSYDFDTLATSAPTATSCPPSGTTTPIVSPLITSGTVMSPSILDSPLLSVPSTPVITGSPASNSNGFSANTEALNATNFPGSSAPTGTAYNYAQAATSQAANATVTSILPMVIGIGGILAVIAAMAFAIWVWCSRKASQARLDPEAARRPGCSGRRDDLDDDDALRYEKPARFYGRQSDVPTLPESVLPAKLWRNSDSSDAGDRSALRESFEKGLNTLGRHAVDVGSPIHRHSGLSLQMQSSQRDASEYGYAYDGHDHSDRPFHPSRFTALPEAGHVELPQSPATVHSSDRSSMHSTRSSSSSRSSHTTHSMHQQADKSTLPAGTTSPRLPPSLPPLHKKASVIAHVDPRTVHRPASPTESMRSKSSVKSSKSKEALFSLRKTATVASASIESAKVSSKDSKGSKEVKELEISLPLDRPELQQYIKQYPDVSPADLSESVNRVLLDNTPVKKPKSEVAIPDKSRPLSQDAALAKVTRRARSSSLGAPKARPATIGHIPPTITVTTHHQALVPPPTPETKRRSSYTLEEPMPYSMSTSNSMASTNIGQVRDDSSFIDPEYPLAHRHRPYSQTSETGSSASGHDDNRASIASYYSSASSLQSTESNDLDTDDEDVQRKQRRQTLLFAIKRQSQSQPSGLSELAKEDISDKQTGPAGSTIRASQTTTSAPKRDIVSSFPRPPVPPLTPPYTPISGNFPGEVNKEKEPRQRSASAAGPKPVLDAALTRFSRIDLASEFNLAKFGSNSSLKRLATEPVPSLPAGITEMLSERTSSPISSARDPRRQSAYISTNPTSPESSRAAPANKARRGRSSTVGATPQVIDFSKPTTADDQMMTASRIPLPSRSKATRVSVVDRVSVANVILPPPPMPPVRSIADDLRASVCLPSGYEPPIRRPSSIRDSFSTIGTTLDYARGSIIDFNNLSSANLSRLGTSFSSNRSSTSTLGIADDDEDDRSVCKSRPSNRMAQT